MARVSNCILAFTNLKHFKSGKYDFTKYMVTVDLYTAKIKVVHYGQPFSLFFVGSICYPNFYYRAFISKDKKTTDRENLSVIFCYCYYFMVFKSTSSINE